MRTLGGLLAMLVLVGVASAARTATVTVRDASLAPARVRVDSGGSVTWRNAGARAHRIASRTSSFAAFTLAPAARKTVRFTRNGAHPYTVDGSRCGVVYVGVALGPVCGQGGGTPPPTPPAPGTKIYTYNVVIRGSFKNEGYVDSAGRRESTWTHEYTWSTTFTNFKFKVVTAGAKFIGVNAAGRAFASTARVTQKWDWLWQPHASGPPIADCEGALTGVVRSVLAVSTSNLSRPNYYVAFQVPGTWNKRSEVEASCSGHYPPTEQTTPFTMADGTDVDMDANSTTLTLRFERETGGLRNPAGALANGRSFTIDTGVKVSEKSTCEGACSGKLKMTERYVAIFTRRP